MLQRPEPRFLGSPVYRLANPEVETGVLALTRYGKVRLRGMTLMYAPLRPVGFGVSSAKR
jgi:hypothetical protein